ncbi:MAG: Maf family protein [Desulfocurvibacter africanus]
MSPRGAYKTLGSLVLASASPRRSELLGLAGLEFEILPGEAEPMPEKGEPPAEYACRAALAKAMDAFARRPENVVLAADTIVVLDNRILGKPSDAADALRTLRELAGRAHEVITGCAVCAPGRKPESFAVSTLVTMARVQDAALEAYVATGEPMDKAGSYAIQGQGGFLVQRIEGSYSNVVGLPVAEVLEAFSTWGIIAPRAE